MDSKNLQRCPGVKKHLFSLFLLLFANSKTLGEPPAPLLLSGQRGRRGSRNLPLPFSFACKRGGFRTHSLSPPLRPKGVRGFQERCPPPLHAQKVGVGGRPFRVRSKEDSLQRCTHYRMVAAGVRV